MGFWHENGFKEHINFATDPVHTPHIDKFAKESLVLSSAMSNCPLSSPHRGSLLTGMYPNKSGIPLNCNSTRPISSLRTDVECVSDVFSKTVMTVPILVNYMRISRLPMIRKILESM